MSQEHSVKYYCLTLCRVVRVHFFSDKAQRNQRGNKDLPHKTSMCEAVQHVTGTVTSPSWKIKGSLGSAFFQLYLTCFRSFSYHFHLIL